MVVGQASSMSASTQSSAALRASSVKHSTLRTRRPGATPRSEVLTSEGLEGLSDLLVFLAVLVDVDRH